MAGDISKLSALYRASKINYRIQANWLNSMWWNRIKFRSISLTVATRASGSSVHIDYFRAKFVIHLKCLRHSSAVSFFPYRKSFSFIYIEWTKTHRSEWSDVRHSTDTILMNNLNGMERQFSLSGVSIQHPFPVQDEIECDEFQIWVLWRTSELSILMVYHGKCVYSFAWSGTHLALNAECAHM